MIKVFEKVPKPSIIKLAKELTVENPILQNNHEILDVYQKMPLVRFVSQENF